MEGKKKEVGLLPNIFVIMSKKYHLDPDKFLQTIKNTIIKPGKDGRQATMEEIAAFLIVANKYGLDPFTNEIYAYPSKKGGIIPVIGIDGFVRKICNHENFDGMEIDFSEDSVDIADAKPCPEWCEVKLYRKGISRPVVVREYLDEVYRKTQYDSPWKTHTKRMLRHKTIIQAGRVAGFLIGVVDEDEAHRIIEAESVVNGKPAVDIPVAIEKKPLSQTETLTQGSSEAQRKALHSIASKLKGGQAELSAFLKQKYGTEHTSELTKQQAGEAIDILIKQLDYENANRNENADGQDSA